MASTDTQKLIISLEAQTKQFSNALNKANNIANKRTRQIESRFEKMNKKVSGLLGNFGRGLLAGVVAGGVTGVVASLRGVATSVAAIGDEARRAGVTTRVFQEWKAVAEQARIPVDAMVDAFKELAIRADEFAITGKGSAAEAFARLGLTPAEVKERLKDPSDLMLLLIERTRQLGDTAAATRIFDELFGGTGAERLVTLLDQSNDSIRGTIDEAHRLGNVLSDDVIARAAEIDRQFNIVSQTVGTALKGAIVNAATALQQFIDSFRAFENQQSASLDSEMATIGMRRLDIENQILKLRGQQRDAISGNPFGYNYDGAIADLEAERAALGETEAQILAVIEARRKAAEVKPATGGSTFTPAPYTPPPPKRDAGAAAAEREANAIRRLIAELQMELALVGATDLERETANALRKAGAAATAEQQAQIVGLVAALYAEEKAMQQASEAAQELADLGKSVLGGMIADLKAGKSAAEILAGALDKVADKLLDVALSSIFDGIGKGGGGAFLGTAGRFGIAANDNYGISRRAA